MSEMMPYIKAVAESDIECLRRAEINYGPSWKQRGGIGAFMMLARKWDRLANALVPKPLMINGQVVDREYAVQHLSETLDRMPQLPDGSLDKQKMAGDLKHLAKEMAHVAYDIFEAIKTDKRAEGIIDDVRDLRRYLVLVEAEMRRQGVVQPEVKKE